MKAICLGLVCLLLSMAALGQQKQAAAAAESKLKEYFFVLLKKGPNRNQDSLSVQKMQAKHMEHINQMARDGKLTIAGPFGDDGDWRGIFIFKTKTMQEAKALVEQDPMIKAGRMIYEIHPWWAEKGTVLD